jgi:hypothetical protein
MNNRTTNRHTQDNFLTRRFAIPSWILILLAIFTVLTTILGINIPSFIWILIVLLLIGVGWLPDQGGSTPPSRKELSDPDASQYRIEVSNFPSYANPTLLKIENRNRLLDLAREPEIGLVTSVAGDLVFAVNNFDSPVRLVLNYTPEDEQKRMERRQSLIKEGSLIEGENVELVPIYLHTPTTEEGSSADKIWRTFQNFQVDAEKREATIEVSSWGDTPTGWGTKP